MLQTIPSNKENTAINLRLQSAPKKNYKSFHIARWITAEVGQILTLFVKKGTKASRNSTFAFNAILHRVATKIASTIKSTRKRFRHLTFDPLE